MAMQTQSSHVRGSWREQWGQSPDDMQGYNYLPTGSEGTMSWPAQGQVADKHGEGRGRRHQHHDPRYESHPANQGQGQGFTSYPSQSGPVQPAPQNLNSIVSHPPPNNDPPGVYDEAMEYMDSGEQHDQDSSQPYYYVPPMMGGPPAPVAPPPHSSPVPMYRSVNAQGYYPQGQEQWPSSGVPVVYPWAQQPQPPMQGPVVGVCPTFHPPYYPYFMQPNPSAHPPPAMMPQQPQVQQQQQPQPRAPPPQLHAQQQQPQQQPQQPPPPSQQRGGGHHVLHSSNHAMHPMPAHPHRPFPPPAHGQMDGNSSYSAYSPPSRRTFRINWPSDIRLHGPYPAGLFGDDGEVTQDYEVLLLLDDNKVRLGISEKQLKEEVTMMERHPCNTDITGELCSICLEEYLKEEPEEGEDPEKEVCRLPCSHLFHLPCITRWLSCNTRCPVCNWDAWRGGRTVINNSFRSDPNRLEAPFLDVVS